MQYFSVIYLGLFLPITLLLYAIIKKEKRWLVLLIASYVFFLSLSGKLIVYLLFSTLLVYYFGLWLEKNKNDMSKNINSLGSSEKSKIRRVYLKRSNMIVLVAVVINIGLLIGFKYTGFFVENINCLFSWLGIDASVDIPKIIVPIGISFYTLRGLSYIIDVKVGKIAATHNLSKIALYMAYFPIMMEGPICAYDKFGDSLVSGDDLKYKNITFGLQRILFGMMKKIVIADRLNPFVNNVFSQYGVLDGGIIFFGAIMYTIQLYMDFSGTMDLVIGSSEMFGIGVSENFKQPFFSKNISDFWTRWHITLGTWFKNYVFYPVSLSKPMKNITKFFRKYFGNHYGALISGGIALFIVWFCNGLWHGAAWTYILFGMYHFMLIMLGNVFTPLIKDICLKSKINRDSKGYVFLQIVKTTFLVIIGELIFRANSVQSIFVMLKNIVTNFSFNSINNGFIFKLGCDRSDFLIVCILLVVVFIVNLLKEKGVNIRECISNQNIFVRWTLYYLLILVIVIFGAYGFGYTPVDPLYANF